MKTLHSHNYLCRPLLGYGERTSSPCRPQYSLFCWRISREQNQQFLNVVVCALNTVFLLLAKNLGRCKNADHAQHIGIFKPLRTSFYSSEHFRPPLVIRGVMKPRVYSNLVALWPSSPYLKPFYLFLRRYVFINHCTNPAHTNNNARGVCYG